MNHQSDAIRVLHVDDEPDFAEMAGVFLEREDDRLAVESSRNAEEALSRLDEAAFDCVVSDYDMPGANGIEFLEAVREEYGDLPFVLFTGKGSEEVASDAISAGVTDYHQKERGTDQYAVLANRVVNAVERARAEQSRQQHLEAIETTQEGISILDSDGEFVYVNESYADLYGYDPEEMLGMHWERLYPPEDVESIYEEVLSRVENNGHWRGETTGLRADGTTFVEDHRLATTEQDELVCTVLDASERRERQRAIEELHNTVRAFIEAGTAADVGRIAADAVADILDMPANGVHLYDEAAGGLAPVAWTDRTEQLVGEPPVFGPGEGLAWQTYESGEPTIRDDISDDPDRYDAGTPIRSQLILPLGGRGVLLVGSTTRATFDETDVSLAQTVAAHATTALDRVEREEELARQNERLETFASIVSHDLRSPLSVAAGNLELAREECDSPSLDRVDRALDRTTTLLEDLHAFAQAGTTTLDPVRVELASLCETCWQHVETGDAALVVETDRAVRADRSRLQQLVENLVRNAVEHGSTSGRSSTDDGAEHVGDAPTITVGALEDGFFVADDGPGIPTDNRDSVFERGFSTGEDATGFGLSIVEEVAENHGWTIELTEGNAGGARFEITGVEFVE